jgi:hypothetical protein
MELPTGLAALVADLQRLGFSIESEEWHPWPAAEKSSWRDVAAQASIASAYGRWRRVGRRSEERPRLVRTVHGRGETVPAAARRFRPRLEMHMDP